MASGALIGGGSRGPTDRESGIKRARCFSRIFVIVLAQSAAGLVADLVVDLVVDLAVGVTVDLEFVFWQS